MSSSQSTRIHRPRVMYTRSVSEHQNYCIHRNGIVARTNTFWRKTMRKRPKKRECVIVASTASATAAVSSSILWVNLGSAILAPCSCIVPIWLSLRSCYTFAAFFALHTYSHFYCDCWCFWWCFCCFCVFRSFAIIIIVVVIVEAVVVVAALLVLLVLLVFVLVSAQKSQRRHRCCLQPKYSEYFQMYGCHSWHATHAIPLHLPHRIADNVLIELGSVKRTNTCTPPHELMRARMCWCKNDVCVCVYVRGAKQWLAITWIWKWKCSCTSSLSEDRRRIYWTVEWRLISTCVRFLPSQFLTVCGKFFFLSSRAFIPNHKFSTLKLPI